MSSVQHTLQDTVAPVPDHETLRFPCSIAQERFWVLDRIEPGNAALNIAVRWQLDGHVSADLVERAFAAIIARHEILRTGFAEVDGDVMQLVLPSVRFRIVSLDLTGLRDDQPLREAERIGQIEARAPFDLAAAPLLRVTLVRIAEHRSLLLVTIHHMVCDGWSVGILAREFGQHYDALRQGRTSDLPELSIQYGDYARWYRERLGSGEFEREIAYWKQTLAGLPYMEVPADKPHRPSLAAGGDIAGLLLDRSLTDQLQVMSSRQGNTLFVTALTALMILLNRYTGQTDIGVGTQVVGRDEVELETMVGVFINTVVLRCDISDNPLLPQMMQRVQDVVQGALDHQNLPMEQLIQVLQPKRDMTRNPFFSVNFIFQRSFIKNERHTDFKLVDLPSHSPGGLYDLNFFMVERPEGWRISCEYNSDLFLRETVSHQLECLRTLLVGMVHNPEQRVAELSLLGEAEQERLTRFGMGAVADYPQHHLVHQLVEEQVLRSPKSIAVVHGDKRLTYAQLDKASNRLANYLRGQGLLPGTLVGLLLPRGIDLVVTLLAVLKAGGAYVPFDPAYPADQLEQMMKEKRLPLILTQTHRSELFAKAERVIALDTARTAIAREQPGRPEILTSANQLAYVAFASGPKERRRMVPVPHRALVNLLYSMTANPGLEASDTLVGISTVGSGMATVELLLPLLVGAKLVLAGAFESDNVGALLTLLQRSKATVMQARPAVWHRLLEAGWTGTPGFRMLCHADGLDRSLADRLLATGGALWSLYGLPEAAIWSMIIRVEPGTGRIPLGTPIVNTQAHVLDQAGRVMPAGAIGELHVTAAAQSGVDLARRSLQQPGMAGEALRLCRTGDLARRRDDGRLDHVGRAGQMMRVRGFRIEPADIQDEMLRHSGVSEAALAMVRGEEGIQLLAAYVVPRAAESASASATPSGSAILVEALQARLSRALPKYMVPDTITVLPALPRTADDRIDYDKLGTAALLSVSGSDNLATHDVEERLLRIWNALLGHTDITVTDDFFDLGGHSLLAARLLTGIFKEFGKQIDFATLFHAPTVQKLAELLVREEDLARDGQVVQVQPEGRLAPVFGIDHTWIYDNLARELGSDRPFFAIQAIQTVAEERDGTVLPDTRTLQQMAAEHIRLIRRQQPRGPYVLLGLCMAGVLAYEIAQQLQDQGEEVPLLVLIDTWSPGYLARQSHSSARLADLSYRWQILMSDFRRGSDHRLSSMLGFAATRLRQFISKRTRGRMTRRVAMLDNGPDLDPIVLLNAAARTAAQRPFTGRICLFYRDTMPSGRFLDPQLGWGDFAAGGIEIHPLPGDHFSMFRDPGVTTMARIVDGILAAGNV